MTSPIEQAWGAGPSERYESIAAKFRPVFDRIAQGAVEREVGRVLPAEQVQWLREAGFNTLRIPVEYGGAGLTLPEYFHLLIELGHADSNLTQIVRGHAGFIENTLNTRNKEFRERWLARLGNEQSLIGPGWTEPGDASQAVFATKVSATASGHVLNGVKFYTTGALFSDWIDVGASDEAGNGVSAIVRRDDPGVKIDDDWNGFGQTLTASGTARFTNVPVAAGDTRPDDGGAKYITGFYQLFHLANLAGIGRRLSDEFALLVRNRKRNFSTSNATLARHDPQILQVIGQLRGAAYGAGAIVQQNARSLQRAYDARLRNASEEEEARVNAVTELEVSQALGVVTSLILNASTVAFDALGASAGIKSLALDRFWRNARTLSSHNPRIFKDRIVGDYAVNGTPPPYQWRIGVAA